MDCAEDQQGGKDHATRPNVWRNVLTARLLTTNSHRDDGFVTPCK